MSNDDLKEAYSKFCYCKENKKHKNMDDFLNLLLDTTPVEVTLISRLNFIRPHHVMSSYIGSHFLSDLRTVCGNKSVLSCITPIPSDDEHSSKESLLHTDSRKVRGSYPAVDPPAVDLLAFDPFAVDSLVVDPPVAGSSSADLPAAIFPTAGSSYTEVNDEVVYQAIRHEGELPRERNMGFSIRNVPEPGDICLNTDTEILDSENVSKLMDKLPLDIMIPRENANIDCFLKDFLSSNEPDLCTDDGSMEVQESVKSFALTERSFESVSSAKVSRNRPAVSSDTHKLRMMSSNTNPVEAEGNIGEGQREQSRNAASSRDSSSPSEMIEFSSEDAGDSRGMPSKTPSPVPDADLAETDLRRMPSKTPSPVPDADLAESDLRDQEGNHLAKSIAQIDINEYPLVDSKIQEKKSDSTGSTTKKPRPHLKPNAGTSRDASATRSEMMARILEFLTTGTGAKILIVLDQIGAVGSAIGSEIVKMLALVFNHLMKESLAALETHSQCVHDKTPLRKYEPLIFDLQIKDVFKPLINPRNPTSMHPTSRVDDIVNKDSSGRATHATTTTTVARRHNKKSKVKMPGSQDIDKQTAAHYKVSYYNYTRNIESCHCFHLESVMKGRKPCDNLQSRTKTLTENELMDVILSILIQFALYDPHSMNDTPNSCKIAEQLLRFDEYVNGQLLNVLVEQNFCDCILSIIERHGHSLMKLLFAASQHFARSVNLVKRFPVLNVPTRVYQWANLLNRLMEFSVGEGAVAFDPRSKKFDLFVSGSIADCVVGYFTLMTVITCSREGILFVNREVNVIKNFLSKENIKIFRTLTRIIMTDSDSSVSARTVSCCIARFVIYLKLWKEDYTHSRHCNEDDHSFCKETLPSSHHFPLYGKLSDPSNCIIAAIVDILLSAIVYLEDVALCLYVVELCKRCGICCCMDSSTILLNLLSNFEKRHLEIQKSILSLVSGIFLIDLNFHNGTPSQSENSVDCVICQDRCEEMNGSEQLEIPEGTDSSCSGKGFSMYYRLIFMESTSSLVTEHLVNLLQNCKPSVIEIFYKTLLRNVYGTLKDRSFTLFNNPDSSLAVICNLVKCLGFCVNIEDDRLVGEIKSNSLALTNFGIDNEGMRKVIYNLLCHLVNWEQNVLRQDNTFYQTFTSLGITFSNILTKEIRILSELWHDYFGQLELSRDSHSISNDNEQAGGSVEHSLEAESFNDAGGFDKMTFEMDLLQFSKDNSANFSGELFKSPPPPTNNESFEDESPINEEDKFTKRNYATELELHTKACLLWDAICEMISKSESFRSFFYNSCFRHCILTLLTNLMKDFARCYNYNYTVKGRSVVLAKKEETMLLFYSLLYCFVRCFATKEAFEDSRDSLEKIRRCLIKIKTSNCSLIKTLVAMLMKCAVDSDENVTNTINTFVNDPKIYLDTIDILHLEDCGSSSEGYAADTDSTQHKTSDCTPPLSISKTSEKPSLLCPELMIYSLDIIINHHEQFKADGHGSSNNLCKRKIEEINRGVQVPENKKRKSEELVQETLTNPTGGSDPAPDESDPAPDESKKDLISVHDDIGPESGTCDKINTDSQVDKIIDSQIGSEAIRKEKEFNCEMNVDPDLSCEIKNDRVVFGKINKTCKAKSEINEDGQVDCETDKVCDYLDEIKKDSEVGEITVDDSSSIAIDTDELDEKDKVREHKTGGNRDTESEFLNTCLASANEKETAEGGGVSSKLDSLFSGARKRRNRKGRAIVNKLDNLTVQKVGDKVETPQPNVPHNFQEIYKNFSFGQPELDYQSNIFKDNVPHPQQVPYFDSSQTLSSINGTPNPMDSSSLRDKTLFSDSKTNKDTGDSHFSDAIPSVHSTPMKSRENVEVSSEETHACYLLKSLENFLSICKGSKEACAQLHNLGILTKLINGFENLIKENNPMYKDVIATIIDIWAEIAQWNIRSSDLSIFFGLFKAENSPADLLLRSFKKVLDSIGVEPHHFLKFPCPSIPLFDEDESSKLSLSLASFVEVKVPVNPVVNDLILLRNTQLKNHVLSCLSLSAVVCPIPRNLDWNLYSNGVSIATWVKFESRKIKKHDASGPKTGKRGPPCVFSRAPFTLINTGEENDNEEKDFIFWRDLRTRNHIFSIGSQRLMFTIYVKPNLDKLYLSVTTESDMESIFLDETSIPNVGFNEPGWHHLAVTFPKFDVVKGELIMVNIIVDGIKSMSATLQLHPLQPISKSVPSYLMLGHVDISSLEEHHRQTMDARGHSSKTTDQSWKEEELEEVLYSLMTYLTHSVSIGVTFMFRDEVLIQETCYCLMALGKNAVSLMVTAAKPESTLFPFFINQKLLTSQLDLSFLFRDFRSLLKPLRESILLLYSTKHHNEYICYERIHPTVPDIENTYPRGKTHNALLFGVLDVIHKETSDVALLRIGGASQLTFLAARLCEMEKNSKVFSEYLSLLFKSCRAEPTFATQFYAFGGPSLICRLVKSQLVPSSFLVLKALIECCLSNGVTKFLPKKNIFKILNCVPTLLIDRCLFQTILVNWRCFLEKDFKDDEYTCIDVDGTELTSIGFTLSVINLMLNVSNPYHLFNLIQLRDINALKRIIEIFEEMKVEGLPFELVCSAELVVQSLAKLMYAVIPNEDLPSESTQKAKFVSGSPIKISPIKGSPIKGSPVQISPNKISPIKISPSKGSSSKGSPKKNMLVGEKKDLTLVLRGLDIPSLTGEDLKIIGDFLLFLHPDECTNVSVERSHAFYLTKISHSSSKEGSIANLVTLSDGSKELDSKFSKCSLQTGATLSLENNPDLLIVEEGEDVLTGNSLSPIKKIITKVEAITLQTPKSSSPRATFPLWSEAEESSDTQDLSRSLLSNPEDSVSLIPVSTNAITVGTQQSPSLLSHVLKDESRPTDFTTDGSDRVLSCRKKVLVSKFDRRIKNSSSDSDSISSPCKKRSFKRGPVKEVSSDGSSSSNYFGLHCLRKESIEEMSMANLVVVGLLNVIEATLSSLPQAEVTSILKEMFSIDIVIILTNNPTAAVRAASLKLFRTMLFSCSKDSYKLSVSKKISYLMAQQLYKHPAVSESLVSEAFALALKLSNKLKEISIEDLEVKSDQKMSLLVPLFAVLPYSVNDTLLCHNTLTALLKILKLNEHLLIKILYKTHVLDSLLLTLQNSCHASSQTDYATSQKESEIIVDDISEICCHVVKTLIASPLQLAFTTSLEVLNHLNLFSRNEVKNCGFSKFCTAAFLEAEAAAIEVGLLRITNASLSCKKLLSSELPGISRRKEGTSRVLLSPASTSAFSSISSLFSSKAISNPIKAVHDYVTPPTSPTKAFIHNITERLLPIPDTPPTGAYLYEEGSDEIPLLEVEKLSPKILVRSRRTRHPAGRSQPFIFPLITPTMERGCVKAIKPLKEKTESSYEAMERSHYEYSITVNDPYDYLAFPPSEMELYGAPSEYYESVSAMRRGSDLSSQLLQPRKRPSSLPLTPSKKDQKKSPNSVKILEKSIAKFEAENIVYSSRPDTTDFFSAANCMQVAGSYKDVGYRGKGSLVSPSSKLNEATKQSVSTKPKSPIKAIVKKVKNSKVGSNGSKVKIGGAPFNKTEKPIQKAEKPIQKAEKPIQKAEKPIQKAEKPIQKAKKPIQKAEKPIQKPSIIRKIKSPSHSSTTYRRVKNSETYESEFDCSRTMVEGVTKKSPLRANISPKIDRNLIFEPLEPITADIKPQLEIHKTNSGTSVGASGVKILTEEGEALQSEVCRSDDGSVISNPLSVLDLKRFRFAGCREFASWPTAMRSSDNSKSFSSLRQLVDIMKNKKVAAEAPIIRHTFTKSKSVDGHPIQPSRSSDMPNFKSKIDSQLSMVDAVSRFKAVLQRTMDFIITTGSTQIEISPSLHEFIISILEYLAMSLSTAIKVGINNDEGKVEGWEQLVCLCKDSLRRQFSQLIIYITAPTMCYKMRQTVIRKLVEQRWMYFVIRDCIHKYEYLIYRFGIFLHEFLYHNRGHSIETESDCEKLMNMLTELGISTLPPPESNITQWSVVTEVKIAWQEELVRLTRVIKENSASHDLRLSNKHHSLFEQVCIEANAVTLRAVHAQNEIRKKALRRVKSSQCQSHQFTRSWITLSEALSHEKATWNFPESYPSDWKLDSTEGPARIRKRLIRCRLDIPQKFFQPFCSARREKKSYPLQNILIDDDKESALNHIVESINNDENLIFACHATFIAPTVEQKGEFLISPKRLYFIGEEVSPQTGEPVPNVISRCWPVDVILEMHLRRYRLQDCAIEIFSHDGSAFLVFESEGSRQQAWTYLRSLKYPNMKIKTTMKDFTLRWKDGSLTNFEYLTQLNKLAGRSFNDLMQYPIFPFILKDFDSPTLDLADPNIYRDLRKPVPIQNPSREKFFKDNYETSSQICPDGPYHYPSHYSNSGIVLYYMIRVPPFTQLFLEFQDGNFDVPDRTFHTLATTWQLASSDSTSAIRELIPEFFFLPETFLNTQGFELGIRQNNKVVNHVELPSWAQSDPRRFVLIHRAILESTHVTKNIQHWIDLVFGCKQSGKLAVEAINVFHPATYFGYDVEKGGDELEVEARKTMIRTYGQAPRQLFSNPHPAFNASLTTINPKKESQNIPQVWKEVKGIQWGVYALSPADLNPTATVIRSLQDNYVSVEPLWENEMILLQSNTVVYHYKPMNEIPAVYTITWGYNDGIIRSKRYAHRTVHPVIYHQSYNKASCCAVNDHRLWVGTECGQIIVYVLGAANGQLELSANSLNHPLIAHDDVITSIVISHQFKVCFTGSKDGMIALWDTNRLSYIRSVTLAGSSIDHLAVSETLGDWIVVSNNGQSSSIIRYYTINTDFLDSVTTSSVVNCITFSNAPEGRNVNVIAACLADGTIRLYSTWDLSEVRKIDVTDKAKGPGICLRFTPNNASLCMITESRLLVVWNSSLKKCKEPKFTFNVR